MPVRLSTAARSLAFLALVSAPCIAAGKAEARSDLAAAVPVPSAAGLGYADAEQYRTALDLADAGDLDPALAIARRYNDPLFTDLVMWTEVAQRDTIASFDEIAGLIDRRPDWPLRSKLFRQAEKQMPLTMSPREAVQWFDGHPPVSDVGEIRYAEALMATGQRAKGEALLRKTWVEGDFPLNEEARIRARYARFFTPDENARRLDELLWRGLGGDARRQAEALGGGYEALADARSRLAARQPGVDDAIYRIPESLQNDPGLIYERASWRRWHGMLDGVVELLNLPQSAVKAEKWWSMRRWAAREALDLGDASTAYRVTSRHGMSDADGYSFSEAEWLSGWIALRYLHQPQQAWRHFDTFYKSVSTPVSLGRGAYWMGRAAEASGNRDAANAWYRKAASFGTTFYGQLGAARIPGVQPLLPDPVRPPSAAQKAAFDRRDPVRAARLLGHLGERGRLVAFLGYLTSSAKDATEAQLVGDLAMAVGRPSYAVHVARSVRRDGIIVLDQLFPLPSLNLRGNLEDALILSVVRQESSFDEEAVSRAGARGLMQLMPGTANKVARDLGVDDHDRGRLTTDPDYNLRLGQAYMAELIDRFGGSRVLAVAAYNAGPRNVDNWIAEHGDPRSSRVDVIDWIERIPYEETRNYVQRVFESLHVYRARLDPSRRAPVVAEELLASASPGR